MTQLNPYINFRDNAREAFEFYRSVLGGDLNVSTFSDYPDMGVDESENDLVMHASLTTAEGLVLMGADTPARMGYEKLGGFSVSISGDDESALQGYWDGLTDGATVTMPLATPPWGGKFGMLTDKFGVDWMVSIDSGDQPAQ